MTVPDEAIPPLEQIPHLAADWKRFVEKTRAEGAAAERDRWRPMVKQIYDAAIEGGKSPAEVRHRIISILDDAGAFGGGPFADLPDSAP